MYETSFSSSFNERNGSCREIRNSNSMDPEPAGKQEARSYSIEHLWKDVSESRDLKVGRQASHELWTCLGIIHGLASANPER